MANQKEVGFNVGQLQQRERLLNGETWRLRAIASVTGPPKRQRKGVWGGGITSAPPLPAL